MGATVMFNHFLISLLSWLKVLAWIWGGLALVELLWPMRARLSLTTRLRGLCISLTYVATVAAFGVIVAEVYRAIGIGPLFVLPPYPASPAPHAALVFGSTLLVALWTDFAIYWYHRALHTRLLWRFHTVHHAVREMHALNGVPHWFEDIIKIPLVALPLALFTPARIESAAWGYLLVNFMAYYTHADTKLTLGPFWRVLVDNRFHRIHHSMEPQHFDKNFGGLTPLWDWMFGTLWSPAKDEWPDVGLADDPEAMGVRDYLWRPFREVGELPHFESED